MKEPDLLGRREFTLQAVLAVLAGTTISVSGCGGGGGGYGGNPGAPSGGLPSMTGTVSMNHGHSAVLLGAQIVGGAAVNLNIQGQATHPHTVALTADEIDSLRHSRQVSKTSSTGDNHTHVVTFQGPEGENNPYD